MAPQVGADMAEMVKELLPLCPVAQAAMGAVLAGLATGPSAHTLTSMVAAAARGAAQGSVAGGVEVQGLDVMAELQQLLAVLGGG